MTVTYQTEVASIRNFGVFWKLLFRWRGSIYKLVWPDLSLYIVLYFTLNMSYRFAMNEHHRQLFEEVSRYCANFSTFIPMSFVLGFYVTIVVNRWWEQYLAMPWPDPLAVFVSTNIHGNARQYTE
ncbi:Bestrophin-2 [Amphibalanus amphitrite]|uniref:Bestrophin homolog n=1 Tax=Amphibalanus amphitrite TaxID=1232801 RepID=A0A6A4XC20_AMPAM|nr:Bestrophin-2 [Amphibalanus amphitrite]